MPSPERNPIAAVAGRQGVMILDGGLATTLEARGFDLGDDLWSARLLMDDPGAIRRLHGDFLAAGADCIVSSSYQASLPGFRRRGLDEDRGRELLRLSVDLAVEARDRFWSDPKNRRGRTRPLVSASVGPYGAYLADGSEYTGDYGVDDDGLREFHRDRWRVLAASGADLLACETIPSRREAEILLELLRDTPDRRAWFSFSCRDGGRLCDGTPLEAAARACEAVPGVAAVGVNCTSPDFIPDLIDAARRGSSRPVIVYPNSGERYDAARKAWDPAPRRIDWEAEPVEWARRGAAAIGGCCRIGPPEIETLRRRLLA